MTHALDTLMAFSHTYCVAICFTLVPINVAASLTTNVWIYGQRPRQDIYRIATIASLSALLMLLHVLSWFVVGVVQGPTFILTFFGLACLVNNAWAVGHPQSLGHLIRRLVKGARQITFNQGV